MHFPLLISSNYFDWVISPLSFHSFWLHLHVYIYICLYHLVYRCPNRITTLNFKLLLLQMSLKINSFNEGTIFFSLLQQNLVTKYSYILFSIVGSYESTKWFSTNWIVTDDFPTNTRMAIINKCMIQKYRIKTITLHL